MATEILRKGKYEAASPWQTLAAGAAHTIILTGEYGAGLIVEAKTGDGDDDVKRIGGLSSNHAMMQLTGPLTYRVNRYESHVESGCVAEGAGAVAAPVNAAAPTITGAAVIGQALSVSNGTWTGTPAPTYTYQWQSSADGSAWTNIAGATVATYTIAAEMDGLQIRAVVTGTNSTSAVAANAAGVGPVAAE